jgi:hypothetical protein
MGGFILMIWTWVALVVFVSIIAADTTCFYILDKVIINYKGQHKFKYKIPGYNIYMYLKWKKEFRE